MVRSFSASVSWSQFAMREIVCMHMETLDIATLQRLLVKLKDTYAIAIDDHGT